jgi:hypothetical protein
MMMHASPYQMWWGRDRIPFRRMETIGYRWRTENAETVSHIYHPHRVRAVSISNPIVFQKKFLTRLRVRRIN